MKNKIQNLVKKYEDVKNAGKLKSYTEEEVKKDFIQPLFESLGWDVHSKKEVSAEETVSSDRVDYGFYLNDRIKFYLEAKKFNVDIHDEKLANQAIKYSFNKGVTWAILTNFETIIVFNAQDIEGKLSDKLFFQINCNEFLDRFDQLSFLSKEAFKNDILDKEAEKVGKKIQKISVTNLLYK
ncbi:MAG: type I restriction enzyme HsdR N-terminal domain-containing protein, partial [Minisyncoccales bacterium]